MPKSRRLAWSSSSAGLTLVELLVTLVILSLLAAAALPYAQIAVRRDKELELRRALRDMRGAIDRFHDDWNAGRISRAIDQASADGYPKTLRVLVDGVEAGDGKGSKRTYLRRIPRDPFADNRPGAQDSWGMWVLRGYQDAPDALTWGGKDVYDVRSSSDAAAVDGTHYRHW